MHFLLDTKVLKEGIEVVNHATATGNNITPILENILISTQFKRIVLTANNLEIAIEYVMNESLDIKSEGNFTVSSKFLSSYIGLLPDDRVEIEMLPNTSLAFKTPTSDTKIKGIEASKFPLIPVFKEEYSFTLNSDDLKKAIEKTLFSTAEGNIRPTLA